MSGGTEKDFSVLLVEHDVNEESLPVWSFPSVSSQISNLACTRCTPQQEPPFVYWKYKADWVYCLTMPVSFPSVTSASLCAITKGPFNPERWNAVLLVLFEQYASSANSDPTKILEGYLSLVTTGHFSNAAGTVSLSSFKDGDVFGSVNVLKELVLMLGIEAVVLWNAVLLKKRILIVSDSVAKLLPVLRSLPLLAPHRLETVSLLRPIVSDNETHLEDLTQAGVWIAGTLDTTLQSQSTLYDVLFSIPERRVTVTTHATPELKMCSVHREVASLMTEMAEGNGTSKQISESLGEKIGQVLTQLKSLCSSASSGKLTEEALNAKVSNESTQQWLWRLANAEGLSS